MRPWEDLSYGETNFFSGGLGRRSPVLVGWTVAYGSRTGRDRCPASDAAAAGPRWNESHHPAVRLLLLPAGGQLGKSPSRPGERALRDSDLSSPGSERHHDAPAGQ